MRSASINKQYANPMNKLFFSAALVMIAGVTLFAQQNENHQKHLFDDNIPKREKSFASENIIKSSNRSAYIDSLITALTPLLNADTMKAVITDLQNLGTRFCLAPNRKQVSEWIRQKFISYGYTNAKLDSFRIREAWPFGSGNFQYYWQYNVFATLEGQYSPELYYLVGGHHDCISYPDGDPMIATPGADDNATAVATALEIARVLKLSGIQVPASIRFITFAAEELGLYGSFDYAEKAADNEENIGMFVNCDMTGYSPISIGWKMNLLGYSGYEWVTALAAEICSTHTTLTPSIRPSENSESSDSYPFYYFDFPTIFLQEFTFSPVYHTMDDVVDSLNVPYAAEIARVAFGMLLSASHTPTPVKNLQVWNVGNGHELQPSWDPNPESDIAFYTVYLGDSTGMYDTLFTTTSTSCSLSGLTTAQQYFIAVSATNTTGIESMLTETYDSPALITLDQGILIVDDSQGGLGNPTDQQVDDFFNVLCGAYPHTSYDATTANKISLVDLGPYQAVLWHVNRKMISSVLLRYRKEVKAYLDHGGKIFFALFQPSLCFEGNTSYPNHFGTGDFIYDYMKIDSVENSTSAFLNAALPVAAGYPSYQIDTLKTPASDLHQINNVEVLYPANGGQGIYSYQSLYPTTHPGGLLHGKNIGVEFIGSIYSVVTISTPLYFMKEDEARALTEFVMTDKFGIPLGIGNQSSMGSP
jgi:hypothetical protein